MLPHEIKERSDESRLIDGIMQMEIDHEKRTVLLGLLYKLLDTDYLTSVLNRRGLRRRLAFLDNRIKRGEIKEACLGFLDIDHFKRDQDSPGFGHEWGDRVIRGVARATVEAVRPVDTVARHGGDEFVVLLATASDTSCVDIESRINDKVSQLEIPGKFKTPRIEVSIGFANYPDNVDSVWKLMSYADERMQEIKRAKGSAR